MSASRSYRPHPRAAYAPPRILYSRILERIEATDYDVFSRRARVPTYEKATIVGRIALTRER